MSYSDSRQPRVVLQDIAFRAMLTRGLAPELSPAALSELNAITGPAIEAGPTTRDLRSLLWCSIDNDDSRDLDQLSAAEVMPNGATKVLVAIADVSGLVRQGSAIDGHAQQNTTSVYTVGRIFPMLPEKLSTDLTSLNYHADRVAMVVEMVFSEAGELQHSDIYPARVHNRAQLAYNSVAPWLEGKAQAPAGVEAVPGLAENLQLQDRVAQRLRYLRHERGALTFETIEARPSFAGETLKDIEAVKTNRAKHLIEDLMVAANGVTAKFLAGRKFPSIRRIVRTPLHWNRIVELAAERRAVLPDQPDARALEDFLVKAKAEDPVRFPDLSLSVIKLMGAGEYVLELPGGKSAGHFGLAVRDYAHSTAPNRRYPDLITQRLLKAAIAGTRPPYSNDELVGLAAHCTEQEDAAKKVERQVGKSAAAMVLHSRVGEQFDGIVTGASEKGTWVRVLRPPVEGKLENGGHKVGQRLRVELVHTDVERGFIDFRTVK